MHPTTLAPPLPGGPAGRPSSPPLALPPPVGPMLRRGPVPFTHLPPPQGRPRLAAPPGVTGPGGRPRPGGGGPEPVRWGLVAAVAVACTLAVSATGLVVSAPVRAEPAPQAATTTTAVPVTTAPPTTEPPATPPGEWDPRVAGLAAFVEEERELAYEHPVTVELLEADTYDEEIGPGSLGFYDGSRIVARGTDLTPALRGTLVHELTHVLDDQHFELFAMDADPDATTEMQLAYSGLVEGNATRVERAYDAMLVAAGVPPEDVMDSPPPESGEAPGLIDPGPGTGADEGPGRDSRRAPAGRARAAQSSLGEAAGAQVDSLVDALDMVPYYVGEQLVDVLLAEGGNGAVDAAFGDPPVTTEQVLDPRAYLDRDPAAAVERPVAADAEHPNVDSVGAVNLFVLLAAGIDPGQALDAATGWGGESVVSYDDEGGRECMAYAVVGDSAEETAQLTEALTAFAGSGVAAEASVAAGADGAPVLTACGLADGENRNDPLEALTLPAMRAEAMRIAIDEMGYASRDGFAYGECVVDEMGYDSIRSFMTDVVAPPGAESEFRQAFGSC